MAKGKIETYIGFCLRANKITLGSGAIATLRGGVYLIILDGNAAKNSKRLALKFKRRFACPLITCGAGFAEAVNKQDCRIAAIRDKELAKAILSNLDNNYVLTDDLNL